MTWQPSGICLWPLWLFSSSLVRQSSPKQSAKSLIYGCLLSVKRPMDLNALLFCARMVKWRPNPSVYLYCCPWLIVDLHLPVWPLRLVYLASLLLFLCALTERIPAILSKIYPYDPDVLLQLFPFYISTPRWKNINFVMHFGSCWIDLFLSTPTLVIIWKR